MPSGLSPLQAMPSGTESPLGGLTSPAMLAKMVELWKQKQKQTQPPGTAGQSPSPAASPAAESLGMDLGYDPTAGGSSQKALDLADKAKGGIGLTPEWLALANSPVASKLFNFMLPGAQEMGMDENGGFS